jgi:hypothetical protein
MLQSGSGARAATSTAWLCCGYPLMYQKEHGGVCKDITVAAVSTQIKATASCFVSTTTDKPNS